MLGTAGILEGRAAHWRQGCPGLVRPDNGGDGRITPGKNSADFFSSRPLASSEFRSCFLQATRVIPPTGDTRGYAWAVRRRCIQCKTMGRI